MLVVMHSETDSIKFKVAKYLMLQSYIFRQISVKFFLRQKATLLQRLMLEWAV